jgi:hypothetical protein
VVFNPSELIFRKWRIAPRRLVRHKKLDARHATQLAQASVQISGQIDPQNRDSHALRT